MYPLIPALLVLAAAGAGAQEPLPVSLVARPEPFAQAPTRTVTTGMASWYGWQFHGRPTASGERYDMFARTAAHPTLPFDTLVRVSLIGGGGSVQVRINDRGPFVADRIIDLSLGAARELGMLRSGVARVRCRFCTCRPRRGTFCRSGRSGSRTTPATCSTACESETSPPPWSRPVTRPASSR